MTVNNILYLAPDLTKYPVTVQKWIQNQNKRWSKVNVSSWRRQNKEDKSKSKRISGLWKLAAEDNVIYVVFSRRGSAIKVR